MNGESGPTTSSVEGDDALLEAVGRAWDRFDPVPDTLAERVVFVLSLAGAEEELCGLREEMLLGARGEERVRTVTFTSDSLAVTITVNSGDRGARLDGWISLGCNLTVELREEGVTTHTTADEDGRFVFDGVRAGLAQLAFHPTAGGLPVLSRTVVTPAVKI